MKRKLFQVGNCPACGSGRLKVISVTRPRRYIKCLVCDCHFKTLEIIEKPYWPSEVLAELLGLGYLSEYPFRIRQSIINICNYRDKAE